MRKLSLFPTLLTFTALTFAVPALADFQTGLDAFQKGDYVGAAKEWRPLAEEGDAIAQFNLGLLYLDGHGVPQSPMEAANWFRRAAEQDYTQAQHNLGAMYGSGQGVKRDYVQAYKWLNICAAKGNSGCVTQRDLIAKKLKPGQVAEAQRLATDFKPQKEAEKQ
jgi:TPR repeat protein